MLKIVYVYSSGLMVNKSIIYLVIVFPVSLSMSSCVTSKHSYGYGPQIKLPGLHRYKKPVDHPFRISIKLRKQDTSRPVGNLSTIVSDNITEPFNAPHKTSLTTGISDKKHGNCNKQNLVLKTSNFISNKVNKTTYPAGKQIDSSSKKHPLFPNLKDEDKQVLDILSCVVFCLGVIFLFIPGLQAAGLVLMGIAVSAMLLIDATLFIFRLIIIGFSTGLAILKDMKF